MRKRSYVTPEQAAALRAIAQGGDYRRYCSAASDAVLWIGKMDGAFRTVVVAPDYTMQQDATGSMLLAWIDGGWINMDAATLADLRAWALGEVAA